MDSNIRLDYALFQLTPTRTRCDLVIFSGAITEKLASGLLDPFLSHLKFAKNEILKGGYSITLRPPTSGDTSWFTKASFQRFVRFVSTPELLERFVSIEKEIIQIEDSIQANELAFAVAVEQTSNGSAAVNNNSKKLTDFSELKGENEGIGEFAQEENSKIRLQRLLKTRKVLLCKEQAMAYARALAAGFEMGSIDDLISFANSFGASRLSEACINFKDLCKKKHADRLWLNELATMKAISPLELSYVGTSGIILASDNDASSQNNSLESSKDVNLPTSDQKPLPTATNQMPMLWSNQFPQYMYNFQSPGGYAFPVMQSGPPYYPGNMHWPPNMHHTYDSDHLGSQKRSLRKKEKSSNEKNPETYEEDTQTESNDSNSESNSDSNSQNDKKIIYTDHQHKKKHKKKPSRQVVIRNINYITSKNGVSEGSSSGEDELIDGDAIREQLEEAVGSLGKHHKPGSNKKNSANKNYHASYKINGGAEPVHDADQVADGSNGWNAFQNLLISNEESDTSMLEKHHSDFHGEVEYVSSKRSENGNSFSINNAIDIESEKLATQKNMVLSDSFVVSERNGENELKTNSEDFENGEYFRRSMKKGIYNEDELLISRRFEGGPGSKLQDTISDSVESSVIKIKKEEDWFVVSHSNKSEDFDHIIKDKVFDECNVFSSVGDRFTEKNKEFMDDSFMIQSPSVNNDRYDSQLRTDISMVLEENAPTQPENFTSSISQDKHGISSTLYNSDDFFIMPERNIEFESNRRTSWSPKMDYGIELSYEFEKKHSSAAPSDNNTDEKLPSDCKTTTAKNGAQNGKKTLAKEAKPKVLPSYLRRSRPEVRSQQPLTTKRSTAPRSKHDLEEENRKKMEELLIQRQKRIAERSTAKTSKKIPIESKSTKASIKS